MVNDEISFGRNEICSMIDNSFTIITIGTNNINNKKKINLYEALKNKMFSISLRK